MPDDADRFRKQADDCREQAAKAVNTLKNGSKAASVGGLFHLLVMPW